MAFVPHMTFVDAHKLRVGDQLDHRNSHGKFIMATIVHKSKGGVIKIHYEGLSSKYDTECSYVHELHRFAVAGSISRRPAHRLKYIKTGSFVDINIQEGSNPGWRKAEVVTLCTRSGQIQVQYLLDISEGITKPMKWTKWVHLDNTKEVSRFGVHTYTKEINHVAISLETNRSFLQTPMELREACAVECIDKIFGGMPNILSFLIKHGSPSQLQQIQQILKQKHFECYEQVRAFAQEQQCVSSSHRALECNLDDASDIDDNEELQLDDNLIQIAAKRPAKLKRITSLSELSRNAISHICGFLNREDIKAFKLTSYQNGIVCLDEMTKCNVGISNVNDILNDTNNRFVDELGMIIRKSYTFHRYPANMDYLSLRLQWQDRYNIPLSHQLLLSENQTACRFYDTLKNEQMGHFKIRAIPTPNFLLFDKRHTIKFDEQTQKPRIMDACNEKQQSIAFVKFFDIYFQEIVPLQFVMGNHNEMTVAKLTEYLENEFIATTQAQREWHEKLMVYFKKMDQIDANHPKLICFKEYRNKVTFASNMNEVIPWWGICIFQLNTTHPAFAKYKFTSIVEKYKLLTSFQQIN